MLGKLCGIQQRGLDISGFEKSVIAENLILCRARREQFQQIHDAKARTADTRPPAAFARLDCDAIKELHDKHSTGSPGLFNRNRSRPHCKGA